MCKCNNYLRSCRYHRRRYWWDSGWLGRLFGQQRGQHLVSLPELAGRVGGRTGRRHLMRSVHGSFRGYVQVTIFAGSLLTNLRGTTEPDVVTWLRRRWRRVAKSKAPQQRIFFPRLWLALLSFKFKTIVQKKEKKELNLFNFTLL